MTRASSYVLSWLLPNVLEVLEWHSAFGLSACWRKGNLVFVREADGRWCK